MGQYVFNSQSTIPVLNVQLLATNYTKKAASLKDEKETRKHINKYHTWKNQMIELAKMGTSQQSSTQGVTSHIVNTNR